MNGVISGRVIDASGAPVSAASVAVTSSSVPVSDIAALTDDSGQFRRSGLEPGSYTLEARKTGLPPTSVQVEVADGEQVNLEVRLGEPETGGGSGAGGSMDTAPESPTGSERADMLEVELQPHLIDWSQVRLVRVALDYPGSGIGDATGKDFLLTPRSHDGSTWQVPLNDTNHGTYDYEIEYFLADGSRKSMNATDVSERTLILNPVQ
jgi:hypothetical protein